MSQPTKPRSRGCFFYGCLIGVVCMVAVLLALLAGLHYTKKMVAEYTATSPVTLPIPADNPALTAQARHRVEQFQEVMKTGATPPALVLSMDEINCLVQTSPELAELKGKVVVTRMQDGRMEGEISAPLERLGLNVFRGRYINGKITLTAWLKDGRLYVTPQEIVANGRTLPGIYMNRLRRENLAAAANQDPASISIFSRLQEIKIQDGKLTVLPKAP